MSKNVLFLLHGIGQHSDSWAVDEGGPISTLEHVAQQYDFFNGKKVNDFIDFIPIRYDDIFDKILNNWGKMSEDILNSAGAISPNFIKDTLEVMEKAGDKKNAFIRTGGDVILYKGFNLFAQRVKLRVISGIAKTIANKTTGRDGNPIRFSIAAHSMGTAVAHDALQHLGTEDWLNKDFSYDYNEDNKDASKEVADLKNNLFGKNPYSPAAFRFDCLFMLSNTSNLLYTTTQDPYESIVKPGTGGHPDSYLQSYFNIAHEFDPIPKVKPFIMPDNWKLFGGGIDISDLNHFYDYNIHSFSHYLIHPKVHLQIFRSLIDSYEPTPKDLDILDDFPKWDSKKFPIPDNQLREKLRGLIESVNGNTDIKQFINIYQTLTKGDI